MPLPPNGAHNVASLVRIERSRRRIRVSVSVNSRCDRSRQFPFGEPLMIEASAAPVDHQAIRFSVYFLVSLNCVAMTDTELANGTYNLRLERHGPSSTWRDQ
jgi:hypothetical protein